MIQFPFFVSDFQLRHGIVSFSFRGKKKESGTFPSLLVMVSLRQANCLHLLSHNIIVKSLREFLGEEFQKVLVVRLI